LKHAKRYFRCGRCGSEFWIPSENCKGVDECLICEEPLRRKIAKKWMKEFVKPEVIVRRIIRRRIIRRRVIHGTR
jgi:hypothetical protein